MVDFSVKTTGLSEPDVRSARFIREGVVDKSKAIKMEALTGLVKDIGTEGLAAYEGMQIADLSSELAKPFEELKKQREIPLEIAGGKLVEENLWKLAAESSEVVPEDITSAEKYTKEAMEKWKKANEQGLISSSTLNTRILSTLRDAVNKNPGLASKLTKYASDYLELSGANSLIKGMEKEEQRVAKQQEDMFKQIATDADKYDVTYNHYTLATDGNEQRRVINDINERKMQKYVSEQITRENSENKIRTSQEAKKLVADFGPSLIAGDTYKLNTQMIDLFKNSSPSDYPRIKQMLAQETQFAKNRLVSWAMRNKVINEPETQELIKRHSESLDSQFNAIKDLKSGDDMAKVLKNNLDITTYTEQQKLYDKYPVETMKLLQIMPNAVIDKWVLHKGTNLDKALAITDALMTGAFQSPAVLRSTTEKNIDPTKPDMVVMAMGVLETGDTEAFDKVVTSLKKGVIENPIFKKEEDKINFMASFVKTLGDSKYTGKFSKLSTSTIEDIHTLTDEYVKTVSSWKDKKLEEYKDKGVSIKADILPDGRLVFSSSDSKAAKEMNSNFASRINDGLQASANVMNVSMKEASKLFYPRYKELFGTANIVQGEIKRPKEESTFSTRVSPEEQKGRDDKRLQILYQEREDQKTLGKLDSALEKEISFVEKSLGIKK